MKTVRSLRSATVLGCMAVFFFFVIGCASTRAVVEPPVEPSVETASPPPGVDPVPDKPMGPPPGYVKPENYRMLERIILGEVTTVIEREVPLTSEPAPPVPAPEKSEVKKGKKKKLN
jgi:hypothetical protein